MLQLVYAMAFQAIYESGIFTILLEEDLRGHKLDGTDVNEETLFRRSGNMGFFIVNSNFRIIDKVVGVIVVILDLTISRL